MRKPLHVFRVGVLVILGVCVGLYIGAYNFLQSDLARELLKSKIEHELKKAFKREVTIEHLNGDLFSKITLTNVSFGDQPHFQGAPIFIVRRIDAHYDLLDALRTGGDFMAAASSVELTDIEARIIRSKDGRINLFEFIPPPPPGVILPPPTFRGRLVFTNLKGTFFDESGWSATEKRSFSEAIKGVNGYWEFSNIRKTHVVLSGNLAHVGKPFSVDGTMNATNGHFDVSVDLPQMAMTHWGAYLVTVPDYHLSAGVADVKGNLVSKPMPAKTQPPFFYNFDIQLTNATLKLPFFPIESTHISGALAVKNHGLFLSQFKGQINQIPYSGSGQISFASNAIKMGVDVSPFDYTNLSAVFPALKPFQVTGTAKAKISVEGSTRNPRVQGVYQMTEGTVYGLALESASGTLNLVNRQLQLGVTQSILANGSVNANAFFDFTSAPTVVTASVIGTHILGEKIGAAIGVPLVGETDLTATVAGPISGVLIRAELQNSSLGVANQLITQAAIDAKFWPSERFQVDRMVLGLNDGTSPIFGSGVAGPDMILKLSLAGENVPIRDFFNSGSVATGQLAASGTVTLAMGQTIPVGGRVQAELSGKIAGLPVKGDPIQSIAFNGIYADSKTTIRNLEVKNGAESLVVKGYLKGGTAEDLSIDFDQVALGHSLIQSYFPKQFQPVSGRATGQARWFQKSIEGRVGFENLDIQSQNISTLSVTGVWKDKMATLSDLTLTHGQSLIKLSGRFSSEGDMGISIAKGTHVRMSDFEGYLNRFGKLEGNLDVDGQVSGSIAALNCNLLFNGSQLRYNTIPISQISGHLLLTPTRFGLNDALVETGKGKTALSGYMGRAVGKGANLLESAYSLDATFSNSDLSEIARLISLIHHEIKSKSEDVGVEKSASATGEGYGISDRLSKLKTMPIFAGKSDVHRMHLFHQIEDRQRILTQPVSADFSQDVRGILNGTLKLNSTPMKFPKVSADLTLSNTKLLFLNSELVRVNVRPVGARLATELRIGAGDFGGGKFNSVELMGDLDGQGDFLIDSVTIGLKQGTYSGLVTGIFPLAPYYMTQSKDRPMALRAHLQNQSLSVISLFSPYVASLSGEGSADLEITGPLGAPQVTGKIGPIKNLKVTLSENTPFKSPFVFPEITAPIQANQLTLKNVPIEWKGEDTRQFRTGQEITNKFQLSGTIGLPNLSLLRPDWLVFEMDLAIANTTLSLNFPTFYTGQADVRDLTIKGPFQIPFSPSAKAKVLADTSTAREAGPVVSGNVEVSDGNVTAPKFTAKKPKPSFLFDLNVAIEKEVSLSGGLFEGGLGALAGSVNLDFEENQRDILIKGSSNAPLVMSPIVLKSGEFQFFSRNFELLNDRQQQQFSKTSSFQQSPNTIRLDTETDPVTGKRSFVPQFNIVAATIIEPVINASGVTENISELAQNTGYRAVLARISGPAYYLQSWTFTEFEVEDSDKQYRFSENRLQNWRISPVATYEFSSAKGSTSSDSDSGIQKLIQVLMPGYYKDVIDDFARDNFQSDKTKKLISFYGERQINSVFRQSIRPSERALAQQLGLVDFRVNYDLGNALLKSASDLTGYSGLGRAEDKVGVDLVSRFFVDQMFLRVQTNLDLSGAQQGVGENLKLSELELSYYPFKNNLSLNIANVRNANDEFRPKYSLRYAYEF